MKKASLVPFSSRSISLLLSIKHFGLIITLLMKNSINIKKIFLTENNKNKLNKELLFHFHK